MSAEENDEPTEAGEPTEATPPESDPEVSAEAEAAEGEEAVADPAAPGPEAEEAAGGDSSAGDDSGETADAAAAGSDVKPEDGAAGGSEARSEAPGAELEPLAIESERELTAEERARLEAEAEERASREAEATADAGEEPAARAATAAEIPADARIQATGKRKSSVARVVLTAGDGSIQVNHRKLDEYFPRPHHQTLARQPLVTAGYEKAVDVRVRVHGGGISGQAGAVRHGIARALTEIDPELRGDLKRRGLLTRDDRRKERRKAGLKKARKRPQFSKR